MRRLKGVTIEWLAYLIIPVVPCSRPLGGSKVESAFHPSEVDKVSTRIFWGLSVKSKLAPRNGSSFEAVEPHPWKGVHNVFFMYISKTYSETANHKCSVKKLLWKISRKRQENTCTGAS